MVCRVKPCFAMAPTRTLKGKPYARKFILLPRTRRWERPAIRKYLLKLVRQMVNIVAADIRPTPRAKARL